MQEISHAAIPMSAMTDDDGELELSDEGSITIHDSTASAQIAEAESVFMAPVGFRPNSLFVGREKEIEQLDKMIFDERQPDRGGTVSVLLHGVPGVGKTHIAREYAFARREKFKGGIFWIAAQTKGLVFQNLNKLMRTLAIEYWSGDLIQSVNKCLGNRQNWLLVLDGVSDEKRDFSELSDFAPDSKDSSIIYIARSKNLSILQQPTTIEIRPLGKEASQCLLFKELNLGEVNERQNAKATQIIESVGGLPLAIHAIARRLADTHQPLEKYQISVSHLSLGGTFQNILEDLLLAGHTEAWNLLHILCWFAPSLPVQMLLFGLEDLKDVSVNASEDGQVPDINTTLAQLIRYALIERNEPDDAMNRDSELDARMDREPIDTIKMHTVIQDFCCDSLKNKLAEWLEHAVQVFCSSYRRADSKMKQQSDGTRVHDDRHYMNYLHYMTHGQKLWEHCLLYSTRDRSLGHVQERLKPVMESVEQETGRRNLLEAHPKSNSQWFQALVSDRNSQNDSPSPYFDSAHDKSMSYAEAKALFQRPQSETVSYGAGAAMQAGSQFGDDRAVSERVQWDTKVSKALLSRSDTHTNDSQLFRAH